MIPVVGIKLGRFCTITDITLMTNAKQNWPASRMQRF